MTDSRYGGAHQRERRRLMRRFQPGVTCCARCGSPILFAADAHLDHVDGADGPVYLGLSHARCNRLAAVATRKAIYAAGKAATGNGQLPARPAQRQPATVRTLDPAAVAPEGVQLVDPAGYAWRPRLVDVCSDRAMGFVCRYAARADGLHPPRRCWP